ncbi:MAG: hypothetical protein EKK41_03135 [Hyphomicrobiales bacterium]|nr:MAG: hypothetical protein EKK41_03135 [Hyphomicrobiales bacterium]
MSSTITDTLPPALSTVEAIGEASDPVARRKRRIESFHPAWQRQVAAITAGNPEIEDLADSFPALLFALVSDYGAPAARDAALAIVASGAPLKHASDALALPFWLRRLPALAFERRLPALPMDAEFGLRIASFVPRRSCEAVAWLGALSSAVTAAGPQYALWFTRAVKPAFMSEESLLMMGAWAWFSQHPETEGFKLLRRGWSTDISARRALDEFNVWRRRLRLVDVLGFGLVDCWLQPGTAAGLSFVPLKTVADFLHESECMENCLDQFADQLRTGRNVVFSIRRGERHVACVEIGVHDEECSMPNIVQLRAYRNRRAGPDVWQATYAWLGSQKLAQRTLRPRRVQSAQRSLARQQLWQPYLETIAGSDLEPKLRALLLLPAKKGRLRRDTAGAELQGKPAPRRVRTLPIGQQVSAASRGKTRAD